MKQLLFILIVTADGNIPVAFRCTDGNTSDSRTHIETWNTLRALAGRSDFLYVADSPCGANARPRDQRCSAYTRSRTAVKPLNPAGYLSHLR